MHGQRGEDHVACHNLGVVLDHATPPDHVGALAAYTRACDDEHAHSCPLRAAVVLEIGASQGTEAIVAAVAVEERECAAGTDAWRADACHNVAVFRNGELAGPRDPASTTEHFRRACELGRSLSCAAASGRYLLGTDTPVDGPLGVALARRGCEGEHAPSCTNLGIALRDGLGGVPRDEAGSLAALERACRLGASGACADVERAHRRGR